MTPTATQERTHEKHSAPPTTKPESRRWCDYFRENLRHLLALPWQDGPRFPDGEQQALAASLQDFQLGEQSEGANLPRRAREHAEAVNDPDYPEAMRLFIAEEQRHAATLGRFLTLAGVPLLQSSRLDGTFRWMRRRAGLPLMLAVLLTAEVIGMVFYLAIRRATSSLLLRRICDQFSRDEVQHLRFHARRMGQMRARRARWRRWLGRTLHRVLVAGTIALVWCKHRRALKAGGLTPWRFWRECQAVLRRTLRLSDEATREVIRSVP
jgi:hypothetical protein